jgi:hypothetical protein
MKNYRTTIGGILTSFGLALTNAAPSGAIHLTGVIMAAVGSLLLGSAAADGANLS